MLTQRKFAKLMVEALEDRTVPATLVSPTTMTFQDVDGDVAAVVFSKPVLAWYNVDEVFQFDAGAVTGSNAQRQSLRRINLVAQFAEDVNGASMTVKVISKARRGDGEVHVGSVFSVGQIYGKLDFQGDVGQLTMFQYDGDRKLADSISMNSTGRFDPQGNSLVLNLSGVVGSLLVRGDLAGGFGVGFNDNDNDFSKTIIGSMEVRGSVKGSFQTTDRIDSVLIRGNIDGTAYPNPVNSSVGIGRFSAGAVGTLKLGGSVLGGSFPGSGQLSVNGTGQENLGTVTIGGSIRGNSLFSGQVAVFGEYQSITVRGNIVGGSDGNSGWLNPGEASNVYIDGSIIGGSGALSGRVSNRTFDPPFTNVMEKLQIKGSIVGGSGFESGVVVMVNPVRQFTLRGNLQGGGGIISGKIELQAGVNGFQMQGMTGGAGDTSGMVRVLDVYPDPFDTNHVVLNGSVRGGSGNNSGRIELYGSSQLRINGSVNGSAGYSSGQVSFLTLDPNQVAESSLFIRGTLHGSSGDLSGSIATNSLMSQVTIQGDLVGAKGYGSGAIQLEAHVKNIVVGGSLLGGQGINSGLIYSNFSEVDSIRIERSIVGGGGEASGGILIERGHVEQINIAYQVVGGAGKHSGVIHAQSLKSLRVGGSVLGGDGELAGGVRVIKRLDSVLISRDLAGKFGYVYVGFYLGEGYLDSIRIGGNVKSSGIISTGAIGTIDVGGSIMGSATAPSYVISNGAHPPSGTPGHPYLLRSLTVGGDVSHTNILMGNVFFEPLDVAQVGQVSIGKNWINSLLVVGYTSGDDGQSGTDDDVLINTDAPSSIDSLFIAGKILGNRRSIVQAGLITQLKVGQSPVQLTPGEFNDDLVLSQLLRVREKG